MLSRKQGLGLDLLQASGKVAQGRGALVLDRLALAGKLQISLDFGDRILDLLVRLDDASQALAFPQYRLALRRVAPERRIRYLRLDP